MVAILGGASGAALGLAIGRPFKRFRGVVAAVFVIVAMSASRYRPLTNWINLTFGLKPRFELLASEAGEDLGLDRELQKQFRFMNEAEAHARIAELSARGVGLLPAHDLATWMRIKLRLSERSELLCAAQWDGSSYRMEDFIAAFEKLSHDDAVAWQKVTKAALKLGARAEEEAPDASAAHVEAYWRGVDSILERLPPDERDAVNADLEREVSAARGCELFKLIVRKSHELPAVERDTFWRALSR